MSRSYNQSRPLHKNKNNRDYAKFHQTKMKPYGRCDRTNYGSEEYHPSRGGELDMQIRIKSKERRNNKISIYDDFDE